MFGKAGGEDKRQLGLRVQVGGRDGVGGVAGGGGVQAGRGSGGASWRTQLDVQRDWALAYRFPSN